MLKKILYTLTLIFLLTSQSTQAGIITIGDNDDSNGFPFYSSFDGGRYQSIWDTDLFDSLTGTISIDSFSFIASANESWSSTQVLVQVSSAVTSSNSLIQAFDSNHGLDVQQVYQGALSFSPSNAGDLLTINFASSFDFDLTNNTSFLLDITFLGVSSGGLRIQTDKSSNTERHYNNAGGTTFSNYFTSDNGAVGQLSYTKVPEPSSLALFALSFLTLLRLKRA